jgi:DNA-3-methyladenine glycosylase
MKRGMAFLKQAFFERGVVEVARDLVGVELVWGGCSGVIVETEAYAAEGDAACHTMSRPSARAFVESMAPGTAYVYLNYGMYWLLNVLVKGGGQDGLILVRALEPKAGVEAMRERRRKEGLRELCSGPGKLAMAMGIMGGHHGTRMAGTGRAAGCGLRAAERVVEVVDDRRIGISRAVDLPWRFLAKGSEFVSVRPEARSAFS